MKQKALRAGDAHSHEEEECRKRLRSARECVKAHSFELLCLDIFKNVIQNKNEKKI